MPEDKKGEGQTDSGNQDQQNKIAELEAKLLKAEEAAAWAKRESEKLLKAKEERDKMLDDKANSGDPDAIKKIKDEYQTKLAETEEKLKSQLLEATNSLKHERVTKSAIQTAAQYFNKDAIDLIESKVSKYCDWEDGQIIIKDDKGEIRYSETNRREKMSLDEYMKELVTKYPSCALPNGQSGTMNGGQKMNGSADKKWNLNQLSAMTPAEQGEFFKKNPDAAREFLRNVSLK